MLLMAACVAPVQTPATTPLPPEAFACATLPGSYPGLTCIEISDTAAILQQNTGEQVTMRLENITLSFTDTVYLAADANRLTLAVLAGSAVISAQNRSRTLQHNTQTQILLNEQNQATTPPSDSTGISAHVLADAQRATLPRPLALTLPTTRPVPSNTSPADCTIIAGWNAFHTVVRGDTLSQIAETYNVTLVDLQAANCLTDAGSLLLPGDVLRVPGGMTNAATFSSDQTQVTLGACVLLAWETINARAVDLDGEPVPANGSYNTCPQVTTTFVLRVLYQDGAQVEYPITITVV